MASLLSIRKINDYEAIEVCNLVARTFNEFIAPEFTQQGVDEFFLYSNPSALKKRLELDYFSMVAEYADKIAGMIEVKGNTHISMLYVDKQFQRKGIAKSLINNAFKHVSFEKETPKDITVNSSRYAIPFYESLGFIQFEEEKSIYGVIHIPMVVSFSKLENPYD